MNTTIEKTDAKKAAKEAAKAIREAAKAKAAEAKKAEAAKAAGAKKAAKEVAKPQSKRAMEIIAGAASLADYLTSMDLTLDGFAYRTTKVPGMHVVRVPSVREAFAKLPDTDEARAFVQIIRDLADDVIALTKGSPKATWVIRETGSANLMGLKI